MRCVGYLPRRIHQGLNKNARDKLHMHESKLCICSAWFPVHLFSQGTKECCGEIGVLCAAPQLFIFIPTKGQQTTNFLGMLKELSFSCCSLPCLRKNQVQNVQLPGSQNVCYQLLLLHLFFQREILEERFLYCSPFFRITQSKAKIKHNKGVF